MQSKEPIQQKMFALIDQWQQSSITQKLFCEQNNIRYHVFHYWYGRYRKQHTEPSPRFIKLAVSGSPGTAHAELVLPDGKHLFFHQPVTSDYLKALIA